MNIILDGQLFENIKKTTVQVLQFLLSKLMDIQIVMRNGILIHTVKPCAINSSGTNSGRNKAGVIHGHLVLIGSNVTITSAFVNPSRTRPDDNSIVRRPCSFGVGVGVGVSVENEVVTDLLRLFFGSISITAGLDVVANDFCACCGDGRFFILTCTLSVVKTGGGCCGTLPDDDCCAGFCWYLFEGSRYMQNKDKWLELNLLEIIATRYRF